jgi:hypothetical protein
VHRSCTKSEGVPYESPFAPQQTRAITSREKDLADTSAQLRLYRAIKRQFLFPLGSRIIAIVRHVLMTWNASHVNGRHLLCAIIQFPGYAWSRDFVSEQAATNAAGASRTNCALKHNPIQQRPGSRSSRHDSYRFNIYIYASRLTDGALHHAIEKRRRSFAARDRG